MDNGIALIDALAGGVQLVLGSADEADKLSVELTGGGSAVVHTTAVAERWAGCAVILFYVENRAYLTGRNHVAGAGCGVHNEPGDTSPAG